MCRQVGGIIAISIATAVLASSSEPSNTQAWVYVVAAALTIGSLPLIACVPEHHGSW
jgi:hypothetical protein